MPYATVLGFCHWDLPAAIILAAVIVTLVVRNHALKKKYKELKEVLEEATGDLDIM